MKRILTACCIVALACLGVWAWRQPEPTRSAVLAGWGIAIGAGSVGLILVALTFRRQFKLFLGMLVSGIALRFVCILGGGFLLVKIYDFPFAPYILAAMAGYIGMQIIEILIVLDRHQAQKNRQK